MKYCTDACCVSTAADFLLYFNAFHCSCISVVYFIAVVIQLLS